MIFSIMTKNICNTCLVTVTGESDLLVSVQTVVIKKLLLQFSNKQEARKVTNRIDKL